VTTPSAPASLVLTGRALVLDDVIDMLEPVPYGFCQDGCGLPAPIAKVTNRKLGHVKGQPVQFRRGHNVRLRPRRSSSPIRLLSLLKTDPVSGCWRWTGYIGGGGYGTVMLKRQGAGKKRHVLAHRFVYSILVGPVPPDLTLDHLCRNRACVNPAHLEPVTMRVNVLRGIGPAALNARKEYCSRGHILPPVSPDGGPRKCQPCMTVHHRNLRCVP
jgi:hypothetical protein